MVSDQWSEKAKLGFAVLNPTYGLSIGNRKGTLWEKNGRGNRPPLRMAVLGRLIQFSHEIGFRVKYGWEIGPT